jgi:hypothetical protein
MRSLTGYLRSYYLKAAIPRQRRAILRQAGPARIERADWSRSLQEPTDFYLDCFRYFNQQLPAEVREHRAYFCEERRGFNEDAMHVMWFLLFREFKPENFLEIGVYRGQTISLAALLSKLNGVACHVQGISPFTAAGDKVSKYRTDLDYLQDTLRHFEHFGLPRPDLLKAFSTAPEAVALIRATPWEMVYIDGNHDYEVARQDWESCSQSVKPGGIIVLDDASLATAYRPPLFATAGHPGPSRLAREIDSRAFREILRVGHNRVFQRIP